MERFTATDGTKFGVQVLVTGLQIPWALAFAPDGRLFLTERPGRVRVYMNGQLLAEPALALSDVYTNGESGILGLALHPDFASNHFVYLTYTASGPSGPVGRLMRFRESGNKLAEGVVLLDDVAASGIHNGSRVKFGPDRLLYVTYGDAANPSVAQDVAALNGKVLRFNDDGTSAAGNRFSSPVFTFGHRNPQGLAWHPVTRRPVGDRARSGWQRRDQRARRRQQLRVAGHRRRRDAPGHDPPRTFFTPSVAPSGAAFYSGNAIPAFRNQLFVATLAGQALLRVTIDGTGLRHVASVERLLEHKYGRLRDVVNGPDGFLYLCTSNRDGRNTPVAEDDRLLRIVPVQ